jgi:integrase
LETYEDGKLVAYYALCLFAGIRPDILRGEMSKLTAKDIHLDTGVIHIEPEVSKVNMKRMVTIQPNLAAWLRAYPVDDQHPLIVPEMLKHKKIIGKKFNLSPDILRHTFISMHVAKFRSMGDTALQAGNSESIIRRYYLDIKNPAEAERFFSLLPVKKAQEDTEPAAAPAEALPPTA